MPAHPVRCRGDQKPGGFPGYWSGQSVHCLDVPVCDVSTYALLGHRDRNSEKDGRRVNMLCEVEAVQE